MPLDAYRNWYPSLPDGPALSAISGEWTSGSGVPGAGVGNNGDGYLDILTGDVYVRYGDAWTIVQGAAGGSGEAGVGSPEGVVTAPPGTSYVDTATGEFYFKLSGSGNVGWYGPYISS